MRRKAPGILPPVVWLIRNGYTGLDAAMREHPEAFAHIKQVHYHRTLDEWVDVARCLARTHGQLPYPNWLDQNGYTALTAQMRKHPDRFQYIKQDHKKGKRPEDWVPIAKMLADRHDGVLPSSNWLLKNGFIGLPAMMRKHPRLFAHISWTREKKSMQQHVAAADKLAREHKGLLPCYSWLVKNGYGGLAQVKRKSPNYFKHIRQERKGGRKAKDWVIVAERLARNHDGQLPYPYWLIHNDYNGLYQAMAHEPRLFMHIKRENRSATRQSQTLDRYVRLAHKIAEQHGGIVPCSAWLKTHDYGALADWMWKQPQAFCNLKREVSRKTIKDHWKTARLLAKKHRRLPCSRWLQTNGYSALDTAMRKHPEVFTHVKQDYRGGRSIKEWVKIAGDLARKHQKLPNPRWLEDNGYNALCQAMRRKPDAFAHIKQKRKRK